MIPMVDLLIEVAGQHGIEELVIGMAHRGRLNVLVNVMNKNVRKYLPRSTIPTLTDSWFGRREVPPRIFERYRHDLGAFRSLVDGVQPEPSGVRQSGCPRRVRAKLDGIVAKA